MIILLLNHGADINVQSGQSASPLGAACYLGSWETAELLLTYGADVHLKDTHGFNVALEYALFGADYGALESRAEYIKRRLPLEICARPTDLNVFLHAAARTGRPTTIEILLHLGADKDFRGVEDRTVLHTLVEECERGPDLIESAETLLNLGVDANARGGEYDTALIAASAKGELCLVRLLLDHGADIHHMSDRHGTALDAARASNSALTPSERSRPSLYSHVARGEEFAEIIQMLSVAGPKQGQSNANLNL